MRGLLCDGSGGGGGWWVVGGGDAAGEEVDVIVGDVGCGGGTAPSAPCCGRRRVVSKTIREERGNLQ